MTALEEYNAADRQYRPGSGWDLADAAIAELQAEVERLKWMLDTLLHDYCEIIEGEWGLYAGEDEASHLADLARRWEERDD